MHVNRSPPAASRIYSARTINSTNTTASIDGSYSSSSCPGERVWARPRVAVSARAHVHQSHGTTDLHPPGCLLGAQTPVIFR
jgi:hypothetical protein